MPIPTTSRCKILLTLNVNIKHYSKFRNVSRGYVIKCNNVYLTLNLPLLLGRIFTDMMCVPNTLTTTFQDVCFF
jgi:hypothetical protein